MPNQFGDCSNLIRYLDQRTQRDGVENYGPTSKGYEF